MAIDTATHAATLDQATRRQQVVRVVVASAIGTTKISTCILPPVMPMATAALQARWAKQLTIA